MEDEKKESNQTIVQPKTYANICDKMPPNYSDYTRTFTITYGCVDDYEIVKKIYRWKNSEIYEGIRDDNNMKVVIKVLKPVKIEKIKRQAKILQILQGGPNIPNLLDIVMDSIAKNTSFITEYLECPEYDPNPVNHIRGMYKIFSTTEAKQYLYEILKTLDYANSKGIMHRDIKPQNVLVDKTHKIFKVVDWGLAEFYRPGKEYNVRVSSRYYKAPELLFEYGHYNYSVDMWSVGCIMAGLIFHQEPFFIGRSNTDQLVKIASILGTDELLGFAKKYGIAITSQLMEQIGNLPKISWKQFVAPKNEKLASDEGIDLISKILVVDYSRRLTPKEAMEHPYFADLKKDAES